MSFFSGSSHPIVLFILLAAVTITVYCQIGWMLTSAWHKKDRNNWDFDCRVVGTIFWPFVCLFTYLLGPGCKAFIRLVTAPQRGLELKWESKERKANAARKKQEEDRDRAQAAARVVEAAKSPASEIAEINDEMVKLAARKAELERRPDSTRH